MPVTLSIGTAAVQDDGTVEVPITSDTAIITPVPSDFIFKELAGHLCDVTTAEIVETGTSAYKLVLYPDEPSWARFRISTYGDVIQSSDGTRETVVSASEVLEYDTRTTAPDVEMWLTSEANTTEVGAEFDWTEDITDFDSGSIEILGDISAFGVITGAGKIWRAELTLPSNTQGTGTVRVIKNSVNGVDTEGPQEDRVFTVNVDTRNQTTGGTARCTHQYAFSANPYIDRGGAFDGIFEAVRHEGWLYVVVQLPKYRGIYSPPPNLPTLVGNAITSQEQAGAALLRCRFSDCTWQTVKTYDNITVAARSLCIHDGRVMWFEGSHYSALNEGQLTEIDNIDSAISYRIADVERVASNPDKGEYFINTGESNINLTVKNDIANLAEIESLFEKGDFVLKIGRFLSLTVDGEATITEIGDNITFRFDYKDVDGTFLGVGISVDFYLVTDNQKSAYLENRLRGVDADWKRETGGIYSIGTGESKPRSEGVSFYSGEGIADPKADYEMPWWVEEPEVKQSIQFGKHTGMVSRMVSRDSNLHLISGFGNLDYVDDNDSVAAAENNWQHLVLRKTLDMRVPVLETNDRVVMDLLKELAFISLSIIGVQNGRVTLKPKETQTAEISANLAASGTLATIDLQNINYHPLPASGQVLIDQEVFSYTAMNPGPGQILGVGEQLSGITRAEADTAEAAHSVRASVYWIDHIIDVWENGFLEPYQQLNFVDELEAMFNSVSVRFSDGESLTVSDDASIARYGLRTFSKATLLVRTQAVWAKLIADRYLKFLSNLRQTVTFTLDATFFLNIGDTVLVWESYRSKLFALCEILEITQIPPQSPEESWRTLVKGITVNI